MAPTDESETPQKPTGGLAPVFGLKKATATPVSTPPPPTSDEPDAPSPPDASAAPSAWLVPIQQVQQELLAVAELIRGVESKDDPRYPGFASHAEQAIASADDLIEQIPKDDAQAQSARPALLDAYFGLTKLIEYREGRATSQPAIAPRPPAEQAAEPTAQEKPKDVTDRFAQPAPVRQRREIRRAIVAISVLLVALGVRVAMHYRDTLLPTDTPPVISETEADMVVATNAGLPETRKAIAEGAPALVQVRLFQDKDGNLRAQAAAVNPHGSRPQLTFRWFRNGKVVGTDTTGRISAEELVDGAKYTVEVTATAAGRSAPPITTAPLVVATDGDAKAGGAQ